jgi:hypothetical protein
MIVCLEKAQGFLLLRLLRIIRKGFLLPPSFHMSSSGLPLSYKEAVMLVKTWITAYESRHEHIQFCP